MSSLIHEHLFEGLEAQLKTCNKCKKSFPESYFGKASGGNYHRSECKSCEKYLTKIRKQVKKTVSPPSKDHRCPICNRNAEQVAGEGGKKLGAWCCDHSHKTNEFRGWLCHSCNRAIGNLNDDVERLKAAIKYLEESNGT